MSLASIWAFIQKFRIDMRRYSEAEKQVKKYTKIVKDLEKKITSCEESLADVKEQGKSFDTQFCTATSAVGKFRTHFDTKEDIWNTNMEEIFTKMDTALETARARKSEAEIELAKWESNLAAEESCLHSLVHEKQLEEARREAQ